MVNKSSNIEPYCLKKRKGVNKFLTNLSIPQEHNETQRHLPKLKPGHLFQSPAHCVSSSTQMSFSSLEAAFPHMLRVKTDKYD